MDETESNGAESLPEDKEIFHEELQKLKNKHITKMELIAQSFLLLVAGYETTGNTIHFVLYHLSKLPEIQKRVQEELDRVVGDSEHITYDHIVNLHYLSQVIYETLRMCPPAVQTNRECNEPVTLQGIPFEVGTLMTVPVFAIHYNPEYYPDPEKFDPDRFSPEEKANRDPLTFLPFGYGPRNCVGMRLAEFEIRTTLAVLLRHYNFRAGKTSPDLPLEVESTSGLLKPKQTLYAVAERRSKLRD
ncbi:cytochrome P450 3A4-like protein [Aphelenchoides avenae]|nr:cytochrome P450 3A4-like protein [Aphelenchus avenae]